MSEESEAAAVTVYRGMIEASAAVALDDRHFVAASDEINTLLIYERGTPDPVGALDLRDFLGLDPWDIEAGARVGNRIYWISSHSRTKHGENAQGRSIFFATKFTTRCGVLVLEPKHQPFDALRGPMKAALGIDGTQIDIEGLAATPDGHLLIGFRGPVPEGKALLLPLLNPRKVIKGEAPVFGAVIALDLGGRGIRSIDATWIADPAYLILAGPMNDVKGDFALYEWNGGDSIPEKRDQDLLDFTAEAIVVLPDLRIAQIISDDGAKKRNDADTPEQERRFRSIDVSF